MSKNAFSKMMRGLEEVKAYTQGERQGYKVTVPPSVDVKSIRSKLRMTQAGFSNTFGFSLDAIKHWEGGRRRPEAPARTLLTVIDRDPVAVLAALRPKPVPKRTPDELAKRIRRTQRQVRRYVKPGQSLVDKLIAERRGRRI